MYLFSPTSHTEEKTATPLPKVAAKSVELLTAVQNHEEDEAQGLANQLFELSYHVNLAQQNPFAVIRHLMEVMSYYTYSTLHETLKLTICQLLHRYMDLSVLKLLQDESYSISDTDKTALLQLLDTQLRLLAKTDKETPRNIDMEYALACAFAAATCLQDTEHWPDNAEKVLKTLVAVIVKHDIAAGVSAIQQARLQMPRLWYLQTLQWRLMAHIAVQSEPAMKELQQAFKANTDSQWQLTYTQADVMASLAVQGTTYAIRYAAFFGNVDTPINVTQLAHRAFSPPYYDGEDTKGRYRIIQLLRQFATHPTLWLRREAANLIKNAQAEEKTTDRSLRNRALVACCEAQRSRTQLPVPTAEPIAPPPLDEKLQQRFTAIKPDSLQSFTQARLSWLQDCLSTCTQQIGTLPPCEFQLAILGSVASFLLGQQPLSVVIWINDKDVYFRHHPYFTEWFTRVSASVFAWSGNTLVLQLQEISLSVAATPERFSQEVQTAKAEDHLTACFATPLYASASGLDFVISYQRALAKFINPILFCKTTLINSITATISRYTAELKDLELNKIKLSQEVSATRQAILDFRAKNPDSNEEYPLSDDDIRIRGEALRVSTRVETLKVRIETFTAQRKELLTSLKAAPPLAKETKHERASVVVSQNLLSLSFDLPTINTGLELRRTLTRWGQVVARQFGLRGSEYGLCQDFATLLPQLAGYFTADFLQEFKRLWNLIQQQCLVEVLPEQKETKELAELTWHIDHVLKPLFTAYPDWIAARVATATSEPLEPTLYLAQTARKEETQAHIRCLAETVINRGASVSQHLGIYLQLPDERRADYLKILSKALGGSPHAEAVIDTLRACPERGQPAVELFYERQQQFAEQVATALTQVSSAETADLAHLRWYNPDGHAHHAPLTPAIHTQLIDTEGKLNDWRKQGRANPYQLRGQHLVIPLCTRAGAETKESTQAPEFYIKVLPRCPGDQVAVSAFLEFATTGQHMPALVAALELPGSEKLVVPVLITPSQGLDLQRLYEAKQFPESAHFAATDLDSQFYLSLLLNPGDHQPPNLALQWFQATPNTRLARLRTLDADHVFVTKPERNVVYCFDKMRSPLDPIAAQRLLALEPALLFKQLARVVNDYESQIQKLFPIPTIQALAQGRHPGQVALREEKGERDDRCELLSRVTPEVLEERGLHLIVLQAKVRRALAKPQIVTPLQLLRHFDRALATTHGVALKDKTVEQKRTTAPQPSKKKRSPVARYLTLPTTSPEVALKTKTLKSQILTPFLSSRLGAEELKSTVRYETKATPLQGEARAKALVEAAQRLQDRFGSQSEQRVEIISLVLEDLHAGKPERFFSICQYSGLSYLVEHLLRKLNVQTLEGNVGAEPAKVLQVNLLEHITRNQHRFYRLNLSHWQGVTDKTLLALVAHSHTTLEYVRLTNCSQLSEKTIIAFVQGCKNITHLDVRGCTQLTGKALRAIAQSCQQLRVLDSSGLPNLQTLRMTDWRDRTVGSLVFPQLEEWKLDDCPHLKLLHTLAPKLKTVSMLPYESEEASQLICRLAREGLVILHAKDGSYTNLGHAMRLKISPIIRSFQTLVQEGVAEKRVTSDPNILLCEAAEFGQVDFLQWMLRAKLSLKLPNKNAILILSSMLDGHPERIKLLVPHKTNPIPLEQYAKQNLLPAAYDGQTAYVRALLDLKADVQTKRGRFSALACTAFRGHTRTMELLIENKADLETENNDATPLLYATMSGHVGAIGLLLEHKADINKQGKVDVSDFYQFMSFEKQLELTRHYGAVPMLWTPLMVAVFLGKDSSCIALVEFLLTHKAQVNVKDTLQETALTIAIRFKRVEVIPKLLEHKADVNVASDSGRPLLMAVDSLFDIPEIIAPLVEYKADLEARDNLGNTALRNVACDCNINAVRTLLAFKADPNAKDKDGNTILKQVEERALSTKNWNFPAITRESDYKEIIALLRAHTPEKASTSAQPSHPSEGVIPAPLTTPQAAALVQPEMKNASLLEGQSFLALPTAAPVGTAVTVVRAVPSMPLSPQTS